MLVLGLTGSVAMGKSTVAGFFAEHGVAVFDADRAVHDLYRGEAAPLIEAAFPGTVVGGAVDRIRLSARVLHDRPAMMRLEALGPKPKTSRPPAAHRVHPYRLRGLAIDRPNQSLPPRKRGCEQRTSHTYRWPAAFSIWSR